jgi:hypothetical protein
MPHQSRPSGKAWKNNLLRQTWPITTLESNMSHVYLPRLRDDVTLTNAIEKLVAKIDSPVAFAASFNEATGVYHDVSKWSLGLTDVAKGLLVWRKVLPQQDEATQGESAGDSVDKTGKPADKSKSGSGPGNQPRPKRFFGSILLDPDKAGLQVAKIAEEILFELGRPKGAQLRLTLEIEGSATDGYPEDIVDVVRSNIRDLKLDINAVGFEEE